MRHCANMEFLVSTYCAEQGLSYISSLSPFFLYTGYALISFPCPLGWTISYYAQTIPYSYAYIGTDARVAACKRVRDAGGQLPSVKKGERSTQGWLNGDIALTRWRHIEGVDVIELKQTSHKDTPIVFHRLAGILTQRLLVDVVHDFLSKVAAET